MTRPVFRFAPSPNGLLHLGHAFSALLNARMAEETGGRLLLRIEDTDETRARPFTSLGKAGFCCRWRRSSASARARRASGVSVVSFICLSTRSNAIIWWLWQRLGKEETAG